MNEPKKKIEVALHQFADGNLADNAKHLLNTLGYRSERTMRLNPNTPERFLSAFNLENDPNFKPERALVAEWESVDLLFQLMEEHIRDNEQVDIEFGGGGIDEARMESYLFFAIKLSGDHYTRTQLSQITREMNKAFDMPAMILFQHRQVLTFAVIDRRLNKRDESKDVLLKATLIKDINFANPHRAHIDILSDLSIDGLHEKHPFRNFLELHEAWKKTLDTSELNKRFYKELADWYFWAVNEVAFPDGAEKDEEIRNATSVIRLITRLIFVWFIKEKELVPDSLFNEAKIQELLVNTDPQGCTYYKAILQNLFFATLNQEMNTPEKPVRRKFRGEGRQHYNITSLYRYKRYFIDPDEALKLFDSIPFLNGGLFECLDKPDDDDSNTIIRVDGFSDRDDVHLNLPNSLFFSGERNEDLNIAYGTRGKNYKVRGLIHILDSYKFTVTENTPIEEEIALDPELLGKVFENLLASYNPETNTAARKQTGSYYTPREVVDYMTDESLITYLKQYLIAYHETRGELTTSTPPAQINLSGSVEPVQTQLTTQSLELSNEEKDEIENKLRDLLAYTDKPHAFEDTETEALINAIDALKILDPACGSGAFPMGVLHKLVFILGKLDAGNVRWKERQIEKASEIPDPTARDSAIEEIEAAFGRNELDYGRKLYLIENCIYGVDIQPIAVQIAKLRFFISLVVDQIINKDRVNLGVRPLPNLETKFVASDALIDVEKPAQIQIRNPAISGKEEELSEVRRRHFTARTPQTKRKYREIDARLRLELGDLLKCDGFPDDTTEKIAFWDPYDQNTCAGWFDPEWMFNTKGGFDIVLGNPPYVQLEKDRGRLGRLYEPCNFASFSKRGDIYCLFYEKAIQLLKQGGHLCFITSNKWMRAAYGRNLRGYFLKHTQPVHLIDLGPDVFDATVDTSIILLRSARLEDASMPFQAAILGADFEKNVDHIAKYLNNNGLPMELPAKGEPWAILSPKELALKRKIEQIGRPLKDWNVSINYGIKTGRNEAFVIDEFKREELVTRDPKSLDIIKPLLRGRDVHRYHTRWAGLWVIVVKFGSYKTLSTDYPAIYQHLLQFAEKLKSRGQCKYSRAQRVGSNSDFPGQHHWLELDNNPTDEYLELFYQEKIVWQEMNTRGPFHLDRSKFHSLDTTRIMVGNNLSYLIGILNSRLFLFAFKNYYAGGHLGSKGVRFKSEFMKLFPVPHITETNRHLAHKLETRVEKILADKHANLDKDITVLENEIDEIVYSLYELTSEEIAIVEENTV